MDEHYPIKFSFSQFILLMSVGVVLLVFSFFMGARFGIGMFQPDPLTVQNSNEVKSLQPGVGEQTPPNKLSSGAGESEQIITPDQEKIDESAQVNVAKGFNPALQNSHAIIRVKSSNDSNYALELDSMTDEVDAAQKIQELKQKGYQSYLALEKTGNVTIYKVRVGTFTDEKEADDFALRFNSKENTDAKVVKAE